MSYTMVERRRIGVLERRLARLRERCASTDPARARQRQYDEAEAAALEWVLDELRAVRGDFATTTTTGVPPLGTPSTLRPDLLAAVPGAGGPFYEGHDIKLAGMDAIWAVGKAPAKAIAAFCSARVGKPLQRLGEALVGGDERYSWGYRFTCDDTGFKAAGIHVPGGVVMTWWK